MRLIVGMQPVREAIAAHGEKLGRVLVAKDGGPKVDALSRFARDRGAKVETVERRELDSIARGAYHQNVIAYAPELAFVEAADLVVLDKPIVLALDEIEDPQNFGAIVRSAVALGAAAVMWPEHHSAPLTPATFRASAGAIEHARLCRVSSLPSALAELKAAGFAIVGLDANGDADLSTMALRAPLVLVVGAEGKGLRKPVKGACDALARLPMRGPVASLNASVAAAVALYEVTRAT
ncbi:MAG: 23S rRNA (guanosine(2251)-2'-O)-methyltransferase RlmB [Myxococcales bacterium]|nr:23S rRNA (guanosine(2251)-2'-O)-methyltransferase RlmB [Myxococcales bacterium]